MWLTKQGRQSVGTKLHRGKVSDEGNGMKVQGDSEYTSPELLFPYGYVSAAEDGVCAGIAAVPDSQLSQGEVRLYSSGGAEILLKNSGEVVINGQSFPAKTE